MSVGCVGKFGINCSVDCVSMQACRPVLQIFIYEFWFDSHAAYTMLWDALQMDLNQVELQVQ